MSGRLDSTAMRSIQELMLKEKRTQMSHPSTTFLRQKYVEGRGDAEVVPLGVGSVLNVGINPDPALMKFRQRCSSTPPIALPPPKTNVNTFVACSPRRLSRISAVGHQLDQRYNVVKNPHGHGGGLTNIPHYPKDLRELLYSGTSEEYEGRYAYLKAKRKQSAMYGELHGSLKGSASVPMLTSQTVGWNLRENGTMTWAPVIPPSDRGTLIRSRADDAPTLMKTFEIVNNRLSMERILGLVKA